MTAVISLDTQTFLGHNQATYQDLRLALQLNLRRQLLLAVCDDGALQTQLAQRLEADLNPYSPETRHLNRTSFGRVELSPLVSLRLDDQQPDPVRQVLLWLKHHRLLKASAHTIPAFQIVGLEQLTRRSQTIQNTFLASLTYVDALITRLDCRILIWVPRPWMGKIQQAVPSFWRSRSGLFEFAGDPTPTPSAPLSFEIRERPSTRPSNGKTAALELPRLGKETQPAGPGEQHSDAAPAVTNPARNLWTILREDLSNFENRPSTASGFLDSVPPSQFATPFGTAPGPRPSIKGPSTAAQCQPVAKQFTVFTDAPLATVVMQPGNQSGSSGDSTPQPIKGKVDPPVTTPDAGGTAAQPAAVPQAQPAKATTPQPDAVANTAINLEGLPKELVQDDDVVSLWQYIHTLEAEEAGPLTLSRAYLGLGQFSRDYIEAGQPTVALLDFAISAYQKAVRGLLEGDGNWCDALNDLASLYWLRAQQDTDPSATSAWLQQSIAAYQKALDGFQPGDNPETWLRLCSNLGTVHGLLANLQEPLANLEAAQMTYQRALEHAPVQFFPLEYANLQNSLGAIYWRLAQLDQPQYYLQQAIVAYAEALPHHDPGVAPLEFAMLQNNLGIAYWSLSHHEQPQHYLAKAIAAYQAALQYRTQAASLHSCAATNNNLGTAYWDLAQQHTYNPDQRLYSLQQAVTAYENALNAAEFALEQSPEISLGFDIWATFHSIGVVHDQLAQGLPADQAKQRQLHLQQALRHYLVAYQGWQDEPQNLEILVSALVYNIHLSFEILGLPGQQAILSQVPGELLPDILQKL